MLSSIDIYKKWIEIDNIFKNKIGEKNSRQFFISQLYITSVNKLYVGTNYYNEKKIYIEFDDIYLFEYNPPKIVGMSIIVTKNSNIDMKKMYVEISSGNNILEEAFLAFSVSLINAIQNSESSYDTLEKLEQIVEDYQEYFAKIRRKLSTELEQGLFAELTYLIKKIDEVGESVVLNWTGPERNKFDFSFYDKFVEIKSTINQLQTIVKISNENQLSKEDNSKLYLIVYILEKNPLGKTIIDCISLVYDQITSYEIKKIFTSKLILCGINKDTLEVDTKYCVKQTKKYLVDNNFPAITKQNLLPEIFNVKYSLNLSNIETMDDE